MIKCDTEDGKYCFSEISYSNHELFCKQSVLLIKGVTPDVLHVYV